MYEIKTIPKNHKKKINEIARALTQCKVYSLGNDFHGVVCEPKFAWEALEKFDFAKLRHRVDSGTYVVRVHDNLWYELKAEG